MRPNSRGIITTRGMDEGRTTERWSYAWKVSPRNSVHGCDRKRGNGHARRTRESSAQRTGEATNYSYFIFQKQTSWLLSQDGFTCRIVGEIQSLINRHDRVEVKVVFSRGDLQNERQKFGIRLHIGSLREEIDTALLYKICTAYIGHGK